MNRGYSIIITRIVLNTKLSINISHLSAFIVIYTVLKIIEFNFEHLSRDLLEIF